MSLRRRAAGASNPCIWLKKPPKYRQSILWADSWRAITAPAYRP